MKDTERTKLLELIVFFLGNTKNCGLVKLFKLLYFLDMLHFKETGRPVTGLRYHALPYGPVPVDLYAEFRSPEPDLSRVLSITSPPAQDSESQAPTRTVIIPRVKLGTTHLTRREFRIANEVAEIFNDVTAAEISDISHSRNGPWDLAKKTGAGKWNVPINYFDSVNLDMGTGTGLPIDELKEMASEHEEIRGHFA